MNTDCAFSKGFTHAICQDYALKNKNSISISDGCSGSSLSDIGSRVLSITAMNRMSELQSLHDLDENELILSARPLIKMLNLPSECLDATLLCAAKIEDTGEAICYGDGVIAVKMKDDNIFVINIEYTDNYPFYINYLFDKTNRHNNWIEDHDNKKVTFSVIKNNGEIEILSENCDLNPRIGYDGIEVGVLRVQLQRTMVEVVSPEAECIVIMSDGVHSFYKPIKTGTLISNDSISYFDVLKELLNFKNYNGQFVQRRMNKFRKYCLKNSWQHYDDISIATIYLGE